jgi:hypothetical protein
MSKKTDPRTDQLLKIILRMLIQREKAKENEVAIKG